MKRKSLLYFPSPAEAEADGFLAVSMELNQALLDEAYQNGIFPWYEDIGFFFWYAPNPRFVLFTSELHLSASSRKQLRKKLFHFTINRAFDEVIECCRIQERAAGQICWITDAFVEAYRTANRRGKCISVEAWNSEGRLVGGFYGMVCGKVFCGESMFHLESNAGRLAMIWFCLNSGFSLIDCQMPSDHMKALGGREISLAEYLDILDEGRTDIVEPDI
jgi:leucyl/phenylalanyl-tRNA--protein transferase